MNKDETRLILNTLKANYPQSFRNMTRDEMQVMLNLWIKQFETLPYPIVEKAVSSIISTDDREFAPNVGQVKKRILYELAPDTEERALHAWEKLSGFISSTSSWSTMEEELPMYNRLDAVTKRIYSYREAKKLAQIPKDTLDYRRSEFIRLYRQLTDKRNESLLANGNLIELAGGTDRLQSLGYSTGEIMQLATETKGVLAINEKN